MSNQHPLIGIVGSAGAYGRWLRTFFEDRMHLAVIGHDPADPDSTAEVDLAQRAHVLVFAVPSRQTPAVIAHYRALAGQGGAGRLWLEIAAVKSAPIAALMASRAEAVGLHPMTAPPQAPTLKGRVVVVCKARLSRWSAWLDELLVALECSAVETTAEHHDRVMALVQALTHALHLSQAAVFRELAAATGELAGLLPFRSALFEMDAAIVARILSLNPATYEDIQFGNPCTRVVLRRFADRVQRLANLVDAGDAAARAAFRREFLLDSRDALGEASLAAGNRTFEHLAHLLADLDDARTLSVRLPEDKPGSLRALLAVFERHGVNIASLHSARTPAGELHFRFGFDTATSGEALERVAAEVARGGIGRIIVPGRAGAESR